MIMIREALLNSLHYVSVEGSANEKLAHLKAIKEVAPELGWVDEAIARATEHAQAETEWLDGQE